MKNVIILSCSTGQGHNSCAEAIREIFEEKNINCCICEALDFISPMFTKFVCWGHNFMYKHIPGLFRWGYRFNEEHRGLLKRGSLFYRVLTSGTQRLYEYILAGGYDAVICTHVFPSIALTELLMQHPMPIETAFVDTDYTFSPGTEFSSLQSYFIPCDQLSEEFRDSIKSGHRTVVTGIPVRDRFWTHCEKEEAKERLGIDVDNRHLLMMCGSMGCGPIVKFLRRIADGLPENLEVTVICGTNEHLREKLTRRYEQNDRIHIVGYTEDVPLFMDSADLYLTKPGGISVTEAAAKKLPMAFVNPVSGCEKYNMEYFIALGAAVTDTSVDRLVKKCIELLSSGDELRQMRNALAEYRQPNGAQLIYCELSKGLGL